MKTKKLLFVGVLAIVLSFTNTVNAEELPTKIEFSYAKSPYGAGGTNYDRTTGGAMKITSDISKRFSGCKITEISITNGTFYSQQEAPIEIFFTRSLNEKGFYTQKGIMDISHPKEYKTYPLDIPYTLTAGEEFFIGFSVWTAWVHNNAISYPIYTDGVLHTSYPGGYYGNANGSYAKEFYELDWQDEGYSSGMICIKLTIEGDNLPTNLVEIGDFSMPDYICPKTKTDLDFYFINRGVNPVETLNFTYEIEGEKVSQQTKFSPPIAYNESCYCGFDFESKNEGIGKIFYLTIDSVNGQPAGTAAVHEATASFNTLFYESGFPYNMVVEEATGLGCGWCVRGIVGLERTMEAYSDGTFIPISAHYPGYNIELAPVGYDLLWERYITHNPACLINRNLQRFAIQDPNEWNLKQKYELYQSIPAILEVDDIIYNKENNRLKASSTVRFAFSENNANYKVAYVITEDNVGPYRQYNAYSGGTTEMDGWELEPEYVDIKHNYVARAISNFEGTCGDIPSNIEKGVTYHHTDYLSLEKVTDINNTYIIALVINGHTGRIENALRKKIDKSLFTSVEDVVKDINNNETTVEFYDLTGRRIYIPQHGMFIRRQGTKVQKTLLKPQNGHARWDY